MATQTHFARSVWLLLLNVGTQIDVFFADIDVLVNSEVFVAHRPQHYVQLTEVYRVKTGYPLQRYQFGALSARNVLSTTSVDFYERRSNLQGLTMEAVTIHVSSSQMLAVCCTDVPHISPSKYTPLSSRTLRFSRNLIALMLV
jgi:hypothetical protein